MTNSQRIAKGGDDVVHHAVREVFLLGVAADVLEWQDRDGWPIWKQQRLRGCFIRVWRDSVCGNLNPSDDCISVTSPTNRKPLRATRSDQALLLAAVSPSKGVNTLTGEGLAEALAGAEVVVDVANPPSWEDKAVMEFFETSGRNLLAAEAAAKVRHHVALSVVGTERLLASGYFRAKSAQENLIKASGIPYTIVRATQFFEFVGGIAETSSDGHTVRLPPALMQPIVSDDVAAALADIAVQEPLNGTVELAGPEAIRMDELVRRFLNANR